MTRTKSFWGLTLLVVLTNLAALYATLTRPGAVGGRRVQIPLLTAGPGGMYRELGERLRSIVANDGDSRIELVPLPTNGSVENIELLARLENAISLTFIKVPDFVRYRERCQEHDADSCQRRYRSLRAIALLNRDALQVVASKASGLRQLNDLRAPAEDQCRSRLTAEAGRPKCRVYVGMQGAGTRATAHALLSPLVSAAALDSWEQESLSLTFDAAANRLRAGDLDAAIFDTGYGAPAVRALARDSRFELIPIGADAQRQLLERGYDAVTLPPYTGSTNYETVASRTLIATHEQTEAWIVNELVLRIERHRPEIEPLLTDVVSTGAKAPNLITDPDVVERYLAEIPLHEGRREHISGWLRSAPLQLFGFVALLGLQLFLLLRLGRAALDRTGPIGPHEEPKILTAPVIAAVASALINAVAGFLIQLIKRG